MRIKRRRITVITVLSLLLSVLTAQSAHASAYTGNGSGIVRCEGDPEGLNIENNVLVEVSYDCAGAVVIPEGVTKVDSYVFDEKEEITSVTLPASLRVLGQNAFSNAYALNEFIVSPEHTLFRAIDGVLFSKDSKSLLNFPFRKSIINYSIPSNVTNIGSGAFERVSLGSITLPEGLLSIGNSAFEYSGLTSVTLPQSLVSIGFSAFRDNELTTVTLPQSLVSIGFSAFRDNELTTINIPANVSVIEEDAFHENLGMTTFTVDSSNSVYKAESGVLFTKNGSTLLNYPPSKEGPYYIPATVRTIGYGAFRYANDLGSIRIPSGVTTIGAYAFASGSITSLTFPVNSQVTSIGEFAFYEAGPIVEITIPVSVRSIADGAFRGLMSLTSVSFAGPSQLTSIGDIAFEDTRALLGVEIPASVTSIGSRAFAGAWSLELLTFETGSRLNSIGDSAFELSQDLVTVKIPASVTSIGDNAFAQNAQYNPSSLTSVTFAPNSQLKSIGSGAFRETISLTGIQIPASVESIGDFAFFALGTSAFQSLTFAEGSQLKTIGVSAFENQKVLTALEIPANVISIGNNAFKQTWALNSLAFETGSRLRFIGDGAFSGSKTLDSISIPASVNSIGDQAFAFTYDLISLTFEPGSELQSIGRRAFDSAGILSRIDIPIGVTSIGYQAFQNTNSDSDIYFLGNAPSIEFPGFSGGDAFVTNCATGFPESGGWNQLSINVVQSANPCSVVYNLNGGVGATSAALGSNGSVSQPASPARAGYTLAGWSATNGGALISAFPYVSGSSGSNVQIYASWTPNTNTVFYNTGGGSLVPNGSFLTGGQVGTAPVNPTRDGYEFVSWINPDETWRNLRFPFSPGVTSNITIYARWERITVAVVPNSEENTPAQNQSGSQNNSQPSPPGIVPQPTPPQVVPPVALVSIASYTMVFSSGSKALATSAQTEIKKLVTKSGSEAKYTITAAASMVRGLPKSFVSNLAKSRAAKIRAHLIKLGVRSEDISIKLVINKQGQAPASKITVKK